MAPGSAKPQCDAGVPEVRGRPLPQECSEGLRCAPSCADTDPRLPTPAALGDGAQVYLLLGADPDSVQKHLVLVASTNV